MSSTVWGKFYWSDYASDEALKMCSLTAQGLWMRMLCTMAGSEPYGYLTINGHSLNKDDLAKLYAVGLAEIDDAVAELDRYGVFSRDAKGRIYSRRMVRDVKKAAVARKNGKQGGNPKLYKQTENQSSDNLQDKARDKPQIPDTRSQKEKETPNGVSQKPTKGTRLPVDWVPTDEGISFAMGLGLTGADVASETAKFRDYWAAKAGAGGVKLDWDATWRNWIRRKTEGQANERTHHKSRDQISRDNHLAGIAGALAAVRGQAVGNT